MSTDPTGTASPTKLIIIRGNSGSGKSTVAKRLQREFGRGCALIEQDYLRRIVLRERDEPGGIAPDFIDHTARFALDHGYHVILEGILHLDRYRPMLDDLRAAHRGPTHAFYLDASFEETRDQLGSSDELTIDESSSEAETTSFIARITGL